MVERPIPQDILKYKQKAIKNFSAREAIFGGAGIIVVLFMYFVVLRGLESQNARQIISAICGFPFLAIGFIKIYGVPLEKILGPILQDNFISPAKRFKEIHEPELEKFEKSREWIREKNIKDPKKIKKMMKVKPSSKYKPIK